MNGRIYDPLLGRFLSADQLIQHPESLQSYNRYSYVQNNPLTLTDPTGFADDSSGGGILDYLKYIFMPSQAAEPNGQGNPEGPRDGEQIMAQQQARAGFDQGMKAVEAGAKATEVGLDLVPGARTGLDLGQAITGQDMIGRPASRSDAMTSLAVSATVGAVIEVGAKPLSDVAGKVVGAVAKSLGKEGEAAARIEGVAVTALKDEIKTAPEVGENAGRTGRQERLRELGSDPNVSSSDRGWIQNEQRHIETGNRDTIRNPPGKDLAHERGREAAKGYSYEHSNLQDRDLHKTQHKYDDKGRANKERPVKPNKTDDDN